MNLDNVTFPYPVLGINDDILPKPETPDVSLTADECNFFFKVELKYDNPDISSLVKDGYAEHVCEVVCASTKYRHCFKSDSGIFSKSDSVIFSITILRKFLAGKIVFTPTITVKRQIIGYFNSGFHPDYGKHRFNMEPGDILAAFARFEYNADIRYDKLKAVGSFMVIEETSDCLPNTLLDRDKIRLLLPTALYNQYKSNTLVRSNPDILHASIVLNSLTYALCRYEQYSDKKWAEVIKYRIDTEEELKEFRDTDSDEWRVDRLAQILLGKPYERLFNTLSQQIDIE